MATATTSEAQSWTAASVDRMERWYHPLPTSLLAELRGVIAAAPGDQPITDMRLSDKQLAKWSEVAAPALSDLEEGRGFVIIDRLPLKELSQREAVALY